VLIAPAAFVLVAENTGHLKAVEAMTVRPMMPYLARAFVGGKLRETLLLSLRPAVHDLDILTVDVAQVSEPLDEGAHESARRGVGREIPDPADLRGLLPGPRHGPTASQQAEADHGCADL